MAKTGAPAGNTNALLDLLGGEPNQNPEPA